VRLVFDDDVLENLIEGGADVDVAVGEGRPVVQNETGGVLAQCLDGFIEPGAPAIF
jgi:hypothetical protein